jgi:hypothetical protein
MVMVCGSAASVRGQVAAATFGREGTVKVRVPRGQMTPELRGAAPVVADYESFSVIELPANGVPAIEGAEVLADENIIQLNAARIDTTQAAAKAMQQPRGVFEGKALYMVQFAGPIQPAWMEQLQQTGVEVVTYIPSNTYIVYGDAKAIGTLQAMAAAAPHVQWNGAYLDGYKIDPGIGAVANVEAAGPAARHLFAIQMVADPQANKDTLATVDQLKSAPVISAYGILNYQNVIVELPMAAVGQIAARPDVISIQAYVLPTHCDERQDQIVAGNLSGNVPSGPGYLAWLGSMGFTQAQFTASNFCVDVSDSGIDNGTTSPNHFGLYLSGTRPGTSRIVYNRLVGTPHAGSTLQGCDGHGNLNTHIVLGYDNSSGFPFADSSGYHYGLGVCPFTNAGSSVIFDPSTFTSPNYPNLQSMAYNNGARISTNSWGANTAGAYNTDSQAYDALVRDAQPAGSTFPVAGNQEMVIVFAAGNAGSGAQTVGSPGTAKNVITVGAGENVQAFGGSDGCGEPDTLADSANDIATFSSRGPCVDGRKKPEICAPGTHVSGGVAQTASPGATGTANACYTGSGVCGGVSSIFYPPGQQFYTASSGTSHSTPCVAGACALIRQFFINQGMAPASPAMTKAMLMNSARYMNGSGANDTLWSNNQGMGELNLGDLFARGAVTPTVFRDEVAADIFTASGQTRTFSGTIADSTKPFRVTLAWTDAPGATTGSAFKNNLDLMVTIGANTYKGNVFSGANSVTGGSADAANNAESVFLPAGTSGSFTVTVTAANINSDGVPNSGGSLDQDFALVIFNGSTSCVAASVSGQPSPQTVCAGTPATFSVTAGGTSPFTYQWRKNTVNIGGANGSSYTIASPAPGDAGGYDCVVTNGCGNATSNAAALTVNVGASISGQPSPATTCVGQPFAFSVTAGGTPAPTYQWRKGGTAIPGATSSMYSGTASAGDAGSYDCLVTNSCGSLTSSSVALTVNVPVSISVQPSPGTVCIGQSWGFSVTADGTPAPTYQWQKGGVDIPGANSSTIGGIASLSDAAMYDCVVTNSCGSLTSNTVALSVNIGPSISSQPSPQTACVGQPFGFSITAGGTPAPTYQWRKGGVPIPGAVGATYGGTASLGDAAMYDCVVTNACGNLPSSAASLTVSTGPSISAQPVPEGVCVGQPFSFSVTAGGDPAPTYQWRKGGSPIPGAASSTYSGTAATTDAGSYDCVVTNPCGSTTSSAATLSVDTPPSITTQPSDQTVYDGMPATFMVVASGASDYQWRKDTVDIGGATSATYTIASPAFTDAGSYDCRVSNGCQSLLSDPATLNVLCYANCDGSTIPPVLNVGDFTCFLQKYAAADPYANCDGSTTPPVLNVNDFTCFLQKYAVGCP